MGLEDHSDGSTTESVSGVPPEGVWIGARNQYLALGWLHQTGNQVQQSGFSRTGSPRQHDLFTRTDDEFWDDQRWGLIRCIPVMQGGDLQCGVVGIQ